MNLNRILFAAAISFVICPGTSHATNGANLIAYSAKTIAVGGADVAYTPDSSALLVNPSGLSELRQSRFDWATELLYVRRIRHTDALGNSAGNDPPLAGLAGGGYATRLSDGITVGVGLFAAGGVGFGFDDLDSGYGTRGKAEM